MSRLQVAIRLKESQKRELLEGYRLGIPTPKLADSYGCSQNTVIRIVKTMLSKEEYSSLKTTRSRLGSLIVESKEIQEIKPILEKESASLEPSSKEDISSLPSDGKNKRKEFGGFESDSLNEETEAQNILSADKEEVVDFDKSEGTLNVFQEIIPLSTDIEIQDQKEVISKPFSPSLLPEIVYMLVDRTVELDPRPISDFPELGNITEKDEDRNVLCLFVNQRSAKRNCGRNQRVIKVPDTNIFNISIPYLLEKGITRILLEGSLISLDD